MNFIDRASSFASNRRLHLFAFVAVVAVIVAVAIWGHRAAAMTLPVPSGDEALFVWQGHAFEQSNSFVAPELDATKPILLLPLTYSGLLGIVFKIFGCSIGVARSLSFILVLLAFAIFGAVIRQQKAPLTALILTGTILLNARFLVMGNAVRMEPLFLVNLCVALLLMQRGQLWAALGVLAISPMIHPNGVLYLVPAAAYVFLGHPLARQRPDQRALIIFAAAAILWISHGLYVLKYWDGFVHDCAHRFGEMATGTGKGGLARLGGWRGVIGPGLIVITALLGIWRRVPVGYLLVFATGAWLHSHLRFEEPYEPFGDLAYLLITLALLEIITSSFSSVKNLPIERWRPLASAALAVFLVAVFHRAGRIEGPLGYLEDMEVSGMHIDKHGAYFVEEDRRVLRELINSIKPGKPITVEVYPWSDALLIADLQDKRVRYQVPYFDSVVRPAKEWVWGYGPTDAPVPDLYIVRTSRYTAPHLRFRPDVMLARAAKHPEVEKPRIVHTRSNTEIWYAMRSEKIKNPN